MPSPELRGHHHHHHHHHHRSLPTLPSPSNVISTPSVDQTTTPETKEPWGPSSPQVRRRPTLFSRVPSVCRDRHDYLAVKDRGSDRAHASRASRGSHPNRQAGYLQVTRAQPQPTVPVVPSGAGIPLHLGADVGASLSAGHVAHALQHLPSIHGHGPGRVLSSARKRRAWTVGVGHGNPGADRTSAAGE